MIRIQEFREFDHSLPGISYCMVSTISIVTAHGAKKMYPGLNTDIMEQSKMNVKSSKPHNQEAMDELIKKRNESIRVSHYLILEQDMTALLSLCSN